MTKMRDSIREIIRTDPTIIATESQIDRLTDRLDSGIIPGDDYHTMEELYEYRKVYNAHAAVGWIAAGYYVVKSIRHSDGELCFGEYDVCDTCMHEIKGEMVNAAWHSVMDQPYHLRY